MTTSVSNHGRGYRRTLAATTALAGLLASAPAWGQTLPAPTLPVPSDATTTVPSTLLGGKPVISRNGNTLDVALYARNTIINWDGFNIPENGTANFDRGLLGPIGQIAVLNRDTSGNVSQLLGKLTSGANVAVWILNPNGIIVGNKANFSTGSLVLSTLGIADADFLDGNGKFALSGPAGSQSAITVIGAGNGANGAVINVNGGNRGLILVAPKISAYGKFDAHDQDVAFVTATDVQLTFNDGSPLSVQINRGTAVSGTSQFVRGTVAGADALFALASQASVTDALLQVDASVTTATSGTRGIVLSAGKLATALDGVVVTGAAADVGGTVKLTVTGSLTTTDNDGSDILGGATGVATLASALTSRRDILLTGAGNVAVSGAVDAGRDVLATGAGDVTVAGAVTAGRTYSVSGYNVTLGGTNPAVLVTQRANGAINITANRALTGRAGLTLFANADGSDQNPEALTLAATFDGIVTAPDGTITRVPSGAINFATQTALRGGSDRESMVRIRSGAANGVVSLGKVTAHDLVGAVGTAGFTTGLTRQTALTTGDVSLIGQVRLDGASVTTGALTSGNDSVILTSRLGAIDTRAIQASKAVTIASAGSLTTNAITSGAAVSADAAGAANFRGTTNANGNVAVRAASITADGISSTGGINLLGRTGAVAAGNLDADGAVALTSAGALTTGSVIGGTTVTADAGGIATFKGDITAASDLVLRGGSLAFLGRTVKSGGTIDLRATVGGISGVAGLTLASTSTDTRDFVRLQATGMQGIDLTPTSTITGGANQALRVAVRNEAAGAPLIFGNVTAHALVALSAANGDPATKGVAIVSAGSLTFGRLDLVDSFAATSTTGDLTVAGVTVSGSKQGITLSAPTGTLAVQSTISADGNVVLNSGSSLRLDRVESVSGSASVTTAGTANLVALSGLTGATATGRAVTIGSVVGGPVTITATDGGITLGAVTGGRVTLGATSGDIAVNDVVSSSAGVSATGTGGISFAKAVTASGGGVIVKAGAGRAALLGDVTAAGDYRVTGQSIVLAGLQKASGAVAITATGGAITGQSGLVLASDTDGAGAEALTLRAAGGGIALATDSFLSGGRDGLSAVTVTTDTGSVVLGNVTARSLAIGLSAAKTATIDTGALSLVDDFTATAGNGVTTGMIGVAKGGVTIDGGTGVVKTGAITAANAVSLMGGSITTGAIAGKGVGLTASAGTVASGDITSTAAVNVTAPGAIAVGRVDASGTAGNVNLASGGTLFATGVTASGSASLSTTGAEADVALAEGLMATNAVNVTAGRDIRAPFIKSLAGTLTVSAPNGDVRGYAGGGIDLSAGPGKAFSLTVGRAVQLGDIAGGPISISASAISVGSVNAGGNAISLVASDGDLAVAGDVVAGDTSLTATGTTSLNAVTASGALTVSGGTGLRFTDIAGTVVNASSSGAITGNSATATGALSATGDSLALASAKAGDALTLTASGGDAVLGTLSAGRNATVLAAGRAVVNGDVVVVGGYTVTGASVTLGDHAVTQQAGGPIAITAKTGDIGGDAGLRLVNTSADGVAKPAITLDAAGAIALAGSTLQTGGALGLRAGDGKAVTLGRIEAGSVGGFDGMTASGAFSHAGSVTTGDIVTGSIDVALSSGDLLTGAVTAPGVVKLAATTGTVTTGALQGSSIDLAAGGALSATSLVASGAANVAGSEVRIDTVRAASIGIRTAGALAGNAGGRASLTSTAGDVSVDAGDLRLGTVDSAGAIALNGATIDVAGKLTASRQLLVKARNALTMADASVGTDLTLDAANAVTAGSLAAGGALTISGHGVTVAAARSGGALSLTSIGDLSLGAGQAGAAAVIDATGRASLGALSAGPSITVRAGDVVLSGTQRAATITFQNSASATSAMRLGDGTTANGFQLSNAEVALINADAVRFDQGAGALQVGDLTFGTDTGRRTVDLLTTGAIAVGGTVTGGGLGRTFRFGGDLADGLATDIRVTATNDAGGRLLFNDADLDLRGTRIAVGLASGFLDALVPGDAGSAQALAFIGDGNSALYNAGLGGGFYDAAATTTVSAHTLNVRFGDFALFQNTGVPGQFMGSLLGGTQAMPVMPALRVTTTGTPAKSAFAIFGTINGVGDASTALLGSNVINIDPGLLPNSRINGCLAGSGTGCLTTIVIQPVLQIFDWSSEDVFGVAQDVSTPFDPVVGGNNEELLTGLPALGPDRQAPTGASPQ